MCVCVFREGAHGHGSLRVFVESWEIIAKTRVLTAVPGMGVHVCVYVCVCVWGEKMHLCDSRVMILYARVYVYLCGVYSCRVCVNIRFLRITLIRHSDA